MPRNNSEEERLTEDEIARRKARTSRCTGW